MKSLLISLSIFSLTFLFVISNTLLLGTFLKKIEVGLEESETNAESISALYNEFKEKEIFFSLTLTDEETDDLEIRFEECLKHAQCNNIPAAEAEKNRLICRIKQIKRLSGFNLTSIF